MLAGALVGALLVLQANPAWALTAAALMLGAIVTISATLSRGTAPADWKTPGRCRGQRSHHHRQRRDGGTFGWSVSQRSTDPGRAPGGRPGRGAHRRASAAAM